MPTVQSEAGPAGSDAQRFPSLAIEGDGKSNEAVAVSDGHNIDDMPTVSEAKTKKPAVEPFALVESLPVIPASLAEKKKKLKGDNTSSSVTYCRTTFYSARGTLRGVAQQLSLHTPIDTRKENSQRMKLVC